MRGCLNCPATELVEPSVPFLAKSLFFAACIAKKGIGNDRPLKNLSIYSYRYILAYAAIPRLAAYAGPMRYEKAGQKR